MSIMDKNELKISSTLVEFINNEAIPGTNINTEEFLEQFFKDCARACSNK